MLRKRWFQVSPRSSWCRLQITTACLCTCFYGLNHSKDFDWQYGIQFSEFYKNFPSHWRQIALQGFFFLMGIDLIGFSVFWFSHWLLLSHFGRELYGIIAYNFFFPVIVTRGSLLKYFFFILLDWWGLCF